MLDGLNQEENWQLGHQKNPGIKGHLSDLEMGLKIRNNIMMMTSIYEALAVLNPFTLQQPYEVGLLLSKCSDPRAGDVNPRPLAPEAPFLTIHTLARLSDTLPEGVPTVCSPEPMFLALLFLHSLGSNQVLG